MTVTRRKTAKEMVHDEIDELVKLSVITPDRAREIKEQLTTARVDQHVLEGMTTRDVIDLYNDLANP